MRKRVIKYIGRATFWCLIRCTGLLRPWSVRVVGRVLGDAFYIISRRYRLLIARQLRESLDTTIDEARVHTMARAICRHFTTEALEFFRLLSLSSEQVDALVDFEGFKHIDDVLVAGKGCIIVTAHYGNWEVLARKLALHGYTLSVIARDSDDPGMTGIATKMREKSGYAVFDRDRPIIGAFRRLKANELLGILPDQNDLDGIWVKFFSRPAQTAVGPAVLSIKSGAAIVPTFARKTNDGRYVVAAHPAIAFMPTGDQNVDVAALTQLVNDAMECEIRKNPCQWLWLHDRWRTMPEAANE